MDDVRIGMAVRAIRQRRGWRQADLAERAGVSASLVSLLEGGRLVQISITALRRVVAALDASLDIRVQWRSGEIDRLLDRSHAAIVERVIGTLLKAGWECRAEVTFSRYGDRGSIDVFAWNAALRAVLLIEVKSEMYSVEETLRRLHTKVRLAPEISFEQLGWRPRFVGSALVLPESSSVRVRLETHSKTMASAFPDRGRDLRAWLRHPDRSLSAVWFLSISNLVGATGSARRRVRASSAPIPPDPNQVGTRGRNRRSKALVDPPASNGSPVTPTVLEIDNLAQLARAGFILDEMGDESG